MGFGLKSKESALVLPFEELRKDDVALVGGKCANLGEMISAGIPVPPGFAITATAYKLFIERTGLKDKIFSLLKNLDINNLQRLHEASNAIRKMIEEAPMPPELEGAIRQAYRQLAEKVGVKEPEVAVRSSATAEDLPGASFAGQQESYLFVKGEEDLLKYVKKCFSSLFTARAITYREEKGFKHDKVYLSVAVQKMVNSKAAGVMFTINPVTGDPNTLVIEAAWGVGETVVGGKVTPDEYAVDKNQLKILDKKIATKKIMAIRSKKGALAEEVEVPKELQDKQVLTDEQIIQLARHGIAIERHYQHPQDIEWALDSETNQLYIVQSRPETVWSLKKLEEKPAAAKPVTVERKIIVRGLPASPGYAIGIAHVITDVSKIAEFKDGEVLVTIMTSPDWVPAMRKAKAIITDSGGMTSHAAIVSRELGIPCIVGTQTATKKIKTGQTITIDATQGIVYEGEIPLEKPAEVRVTPKAEAAIAPEQLVELYPPTATKIYMNLGEPEAIHKYIHLPFDGIGLMRVEFIIADWVGEHPLYLIEIGQPDKFVDKLAEGIAIVARAIYPKPVVVRFSDFKTNEYRKLKGGEKYEPPDEANPMLGWRGVSRYISPQYEPAFRLECKAIKKVRDEWALKNVWVMLPFARTTWEVKKALKIMEEEGLERGADMKIWLMAEVPSVIVLADEFAKLCDGFSIGSNDLTQLTLGTDRDSPVLPAIDPRYFDERDPAVLRSIAHLIRVAHENGVTVSICGQGPSVFSDLTEFLVRCGIDSVSVNPDAVVRTRRLVASVERKVMLERLARLDKSGDDVLNRLFKS